MFLDEILQTEYGQKITKLRKENCSYNVLYRYWRDQLFERIMRLFIWENTFDTKTREGVPPKEIEMRLVLKGHCGIAKYKNELTAFFGSLALPSILMSGLVILCIVPFILELGLLGKILLLSTIMLFVILLSI